MKYFIELFESLKSISDDRKDHCSVGVRCKEDKNERLQIFLRAGYNDIIATGNWDVLHSKFFIDMWLRYTSARDIGDSNDALINYSSEEEGSIGLTQIGNSDPKVDTTKVTMTVNALQLAILAKQTATIESLMDYIFPNRIGHENKSFDSIDEFLCEKVVLDFNRLDEEQFSIYDRSLDKMNSLHLSCQYHPQAIQIIINAIFKHKAALSCVSSIVNDKENIFGYAPLHIAAKKSFLDAAR